MESKHSCSEPDIRGTLALYNFEASDEFCEKVKTYIALLRRWNSRIALTTLTSEHEILRFHFGESLFAISAAEIGIGRLADFGSGAGFPGCPLAMALPGLNVTLIESNGKKVAFLRELRRELKLENIDICHGRGESFPSTEKFEYIAARAVGNYDDLLKWSDERTRAGGRVVFWVGLQQAVHLVQARGWKWRTSMVPEANQRLILTGVREA
jgi:16S rRNA (guanine527-N7)-methyltransferase